MKLKVISCLLAMIIFAAEIYLRLNIVAYFLKIV